MIKSFETGTNPVRCAKFIVRKQYIVAGTDDMKMRVFNYNTMDKVKEWEAHTDYIRYLEIHPNRPLILSCSDDMSIKMWDWEKDFDCVQIFEGHSHYVMMVRINPRDTNTFASASLDKTIKVWGLTAGTPHFSLDGPGAHEKGVNCIDYYPGGDKPYLLSGADDRTIKIWDYQTKACLQTLEGHGHNVSSVCFHPRLPLILSASEDGTVRLWHATTYRPETTLNYGLERAWAIAVTSASNKVAIGYDEGTIVLKLGNERPVASLDTNTGKLVWAKNHDIQTLSLKGVSKGDVELVDGERVSVPTRDLGACEVYPQHLSHNSNGSFIVVCGDGEYIIYTSQALRNKAFGSALDFVWSAQGTGDYAIRESISRVRTFKNFKEHKQVALPVSSADGIFGGVCLGVKGPDCVLFYTWEEVALVRKIDVSPIALYWSEAGDIVIIACADCFYVLRYHAEVVLQAVATGALSAEEGVEGAFELVTTINERVHTGQWVGECFLFTNNSNKLQYMVGGELMTLCHLNNHLYLLGYVPKEDRVFLIDKSYNLVSYRLLLSVLSYQTAVVREDFATANTLLPTIPRSEYSAVARFLESQGYKQEALAVTQDPEHKFELAIDLKELAIARTVLQELEREDKAMSGEETSTEAQSKWRRLGDLALFSGDLELAETCALRSGDSSGLLLMHSCTGDRDGMKALATQAQAAGRLNVAFVAHMLCGQVEDAIDLLVSANRLPEAALLARTYMPSQISR
jgi:coatomer subunit beta'